MLEDTFLWLVVLGVLAGLGVAYAVPSTRPYVKKYWWVGVAVVAVALGYVLLRRRPGNKIDDQINEGRKLQAESGARIDVLVDIALEQSTRADAELARQRLENQAAVERFDAEVETINKIDSSLERRKALIKVVESYS